jgi:hypothetical protein
MNVSLSTCLTALPALSALSALPARLARASAIAGSACALLLAGCGGGGNPLSTPPDVSNPPGNAGESLSFAYFQKCINPIFLARLTIVQNGVSSTNTCAGSGCHDSNTGTGGALRIVASAEPIDLGDAANTPDAIRTTDMYKNFYSAQGVTVPGSPQQSRLLAKPLLMSVLHGGGLVFPDENDPNARMFAYWISHPSPAGHDEFSTASDGMFTPADPVTGTCNTQ